MVRSKAPAMKKQQIDFKKIKRKLGRKLPPPNNATNTEIKSKAIIIPEQSVVAEKNGFATSKKSLTLQELLHKTSHHNSNVSKNALLRIQDILKSHPSELQSNKYTIIQCLKGRISDGDKQVRQAFYKLFQTRIFLFCKQEGLMVSCLMLSIFLDMANASIDVHLMAFDFFKLVVDCYPLTFSLYPEKVETAFTKEEKCYHGTIFVGDCGSDGNQKCIDEFAGLGFKHDHCECSNFVTGPSEIVKHRCKCVVPC